MSSVSIPGSRGLQRWCVWRKWSGGNVWDSFSQNVDLVVRWEGLRDVRAAVCRGGNVVGRQTSLLVLHFLMEKDQYCLVGWSGVGYEGQVEVPLVVHHVVDPGAQVEKAARKSLTSFRQFDTHHNIQVTWQPTALWLANLNFPANLQSRYWSRFCFPNKTDVS